METIKASQNTEFDVIYDDGTRHHVAEGVLFEVENERVTFHNGTNRAVVLFASMEALFEVIDLLGLTEVLEKYLDTKQPAADTPDTEGGTDNGNVQA